MKKITLFLFICICWAGKVLAQNPLTLADLKHTLAEQDDTLRVLNLWATWCKPCVEELPDFIALASQYQQAGKKVKFLLVAVEDKTEKVHAFLDNKGYASQKNLNPLFYVLTEKDANIWIPVVDAQWEGEIPATLIFQTQQNTRAFYAKKMTHTELENTINLHLKKSKHNEKK